MEKSDVIYISGRTYFRFAILPSLDVYMYFNVRTYLSLLIGLFYMIFPFVRCCRFSMRHHSRVKNILCFGPGSNSSVRQGVSCSNVQRKNGHMLKYRGPKLEPDILKCCRVLLLYMILILCCDNSVCAPFHRRWKLLFLIATSRGEQARWTSTAPTCSTPGPGQEEVLIWRIPSMNSNTWYTSSSIQ